MDDKIRFTIKTMNVIAQEGLDQFDEKYEVGADVHEPEGLLVRSATVDTDAYPHLLAVARAGSGVNNISVDKATRKGICVFNTPGANANAVVDLVFPMIAVWMRNIHKGIAFCESLVDVPPDRVNVEVESKKIVFRGVEVAGKNLCVVGLGQIGVRLANGGVHRNMNVMGFDPKPSMENIHQLLPQVKMRRRLGDALKDADVVSLHVPLSPGTRDFVNCEFFDRMKRGAILVNYARGPIVHEEDVLSALNDGRLQCYITDFPSSALLGHPNVLATPHLGASTTESEENCAVMAVNELSSYLEYGNIVNSVNFPNVESIPSAKVLSRLIVINRDVPGMIALASQLISSHGINISSYLNESNGEVGYNIIDVESPLPDGVLRALHENENVIRTRVLHFS